MSLDVTSRQSLVSWLNRNRIDRPAGAQRRGYGADLPRRFGVDRLPRTIVVGREGRIAAADMRGDELVALIDALVSTPAASDSPGDSAWGP